MGYSFVLRQKQKGGCRNHVFCVDNDVCVVSRRVWVISLRVAPETARARVSFVCCVKNGGDGWFHCVCWVKTVSTTIITVFDRTHNETTHLHVFRQIDAVFTQHKHIWVFIEM